jgi:hypothetical protein
MKKTVVKQRLVHRIMKITFIQFVLAFVFSTITMASSVNGQKKLDTKITVSISNMSLENALSTLEKKANVKFSYNSRISQLGQKVTIDVKEQTLSTILSAILQPLDISYSELSNQIILQNNVTKEQDLAGFTNSISVAEKLKAAPIVRGRVVDQSGLPLPGATVMAKGTNKSVITDFDGNFTIDMPENSTRLVISYIGMTTQEVAIKTTAMTIVLVENEQSLKEVVITTGYEKTSKRTFTGAISKITGKELMVEGVVDISRMIEGKAAGVTVQNVTGTFGTAPKITVRGSSSIFGDTKPLWVIDGIVQ